MGYPYPHICCNTTATVRTYIGYKSRAIMEDFVCTCCTAGIHCLWPHVHAYRALITTLRTSCLIMKSQTYTIIRTLVDSSSTLKQNNYNLSVTRSSQGVQGCTIRLHKSFGLICSQGSGMRPPCMSTIRLKRTQDGVTKNCMWPTAEN